MPGTTSHRFPRAPYDLVLVGGGLQNGLIALACLTRHPELRIALIERAAALGGNHTWSIHEGDVPDAARGFVSELIAHRWAGYDVRFPNRGRTLHAPYAAITSARFAGVVAAAFARSPRSALLLGRAARALRADHVELEDGERVRGTLVIDARGPSAPAPGEGEPAASGAPRDCGFQKFLGLELELAADHGLPRPLLIDATVPQRGGFRFFYVLPLSPRRLLVEDTVFSRSAALDVASARGGVLDYAAQFGRVARVVRSELGVLPMPWRGSGPAAELGSPLLAGYRGGWFHPATGYSFPAALRLACHVAEHAPSGVLGPALHALARAHRRQTRFAEQLNRLLFGCFADDAMWNVFERFYRLPEPLIGRFYALSLTRLDRARIVLGRPPRGFSLQRALARNA